MRTTSLFQKATSVATIGVFALTFTFSAGAATEVRAATVAQQVAPIPTPIAANQQTRLQIDHDPLACVTTTNAPLVEAKVQPGPDLSKSYVFFRKAGTPYFSYAIMEGPVPSVQAKLPRPMPGTTSMDYFVQATDVSSMSRKTPDYTPPVVAGNVCRAPSAAVAAGGAGLTIGLTDERQPVIPEGFNKDDIAKVILVTGVVVTVAAALAAAASASAGAGAAAGAGTGAGAAGAGTGAAAGAAAGGVSTGVLVAGGVAVAAGVGVGINQALKNSATFTHTRTPTITPSHTPTPTFPPNEFVEVDVTWSGEGRIDDIKLFRAGVEITGGAKLMALCEPKTSRTSRLVISNRLESGNYTVQVHADACATSTATIAALVSVQTDSGSKACNSNPFVPLPTNALTTTCPFSLP